MVRDNWFMGGLYAVSMGRWKQMAFENNTLWAEKLMIEINSATMADAIPAQYTRVGVKTQHFELVPRALPKGAWLWPCTVVEEIDRPANDVPHYLPGQNAYLASTRTESKIDVPGAGGGAATLYPEFDDILKTAMVKEATLFFGK